MRPHALIAFFRADCGAKPSEREGQIRHHRDWSSPRERSASGPRPSSSPPPQTPPPPLAISAGNLPIDASIEDPGKIARLGDIEGKRLDHPLFPLRPARSSKRPPLRLRRAFAAGGPSPGLGSAPPRSRGRSSFAAGVWPRSIACRKPRRARRQVVYGGLGLRQDESATFDGKASRFLVTP